MARRTDADRSGRRPYIPPAGVLCEIFDALARGEPPAQLRNRYPITERNLYRYRAHGKTWRIYLRARWWVENQERALRMLGRGRTVGDVFHRLKPPPEAFPSRCALYDFILREEVREIEFRDSLETMRAA